MDTIITAMAAVARLAPTADRAALVSLDAKRRTLDSAAKVAIGLGTMDDATLIETGSANIAAQEAVQAGFAAIEARQSALILALPTDRRSRRALRPAATPADVENMLDGVAEQVTHLTRNEGTPFHLLRDGARVGALGAYDMGMRDGNLVMGELGSWPLADVEAVANDDDSFGILLADGTLLEIQEDADFVWTPAAA